MGILRYTCLSVFKDQWEHLSGTTYSLEFCQWWGCTVGLIITGWTGQQLSWLAYIRLSLRNADSAEVVV